MNSDKVHADSGRVGDEAADILANATTPPRAACSGHLLITTSTCPTSVADNQPRFVLDLAASLAPHFERVHLLAPGSPGAAEREEMNGVLVRRFTYARPPATQQLCYRQGIMQNIRAKPFLLALLPGFWIAQWRAIRQLCREYPIKVVNSHWFVFQSLAAAVACRGSGIRHVAHSHGADVYLLKRLRGGLGRGLARFVARRSDKLICESTSVREQLDALLGVFSNAEVSCMGVDVRRFAAEDLHPPTSSDNLLFVGRLVEKKGVEYLIRAMPAVLEQEPGASLRIIGEGALGESLRALAGSLGLMGRGVEFLGPLPHDRIARLLAETKVVVIPSIVDSHGEADGMPTVLLEAMAAGRLVVASRVNGIPDVLRDGRNGWLCKPRDSADLAVKLLMALTYRDSLIPDAARKTAEYYDWTVLGARYAALLSAVGS